MTEGIIVKVVAPLVILPLMWVAAATIGFVAGSLSTMFKWGWRGWARRLGRWGLLVVAAGMAAGCGGAPRPRVNTEPRRIMIGDVDTLRRVLSAMHDCVRLDVHRSWVGFANDGTPVTVKYSGYGEAPEVSCGR